jgi:DinB superfamily
VNYELEGVGLPVVLAEGRLVAGETRRVFGDLSAAQINWKPGADEWSIGQCFEHLIISSRPYLPMLERIIRGERSPTLWERAPVLPGIFGRLLLRTLRPDSGRKVRARKAFRPSASTIAPEIIGRFVDQQNRLLELMEGTRGLELDVIVVTSPVSAIVTYSLMDAYRIIVAHEQNHFDQARRLVEPAPGGSSAARGSGSTGPDGERPGAKGD